MFYPHELKDTKAETIGTAYKWARRIATLITVLSSVVYIINPLSGFLTLLLASFAYSTLVGREYYIDAIYKIRTATDLRLRLLNFQDNEYALESLAKDAVWRGDVVDPDITARLEEIRRTKVDLKEKLDGFLEQLAKSVFAEPDALSAKKKDDGAN